MNYDLKTIVLVQSLDDGVWDPAIVEEINNNEILVKYKSSGKNEWFNKDNYRIKPMKKEWINGLIEKPSSSKTIIDKSKPIVDDVLSTKKTKQSNGAQSSSTVKFKKNNFLTKKSEVAQMALSKVASEGDFQFAVGESVLCFYGFVLYEAKCLIRQKTIEGISIYFIHYKGWKERWNEWVYEDRLLVVNQENLNKMETLKQEYAKLKKGKQSKPAKVSFKTLNKNPIQEHQDGPSSTTNKRIESESSKSLEVKPIETTSVTLDTTEVLHANISEVNNATIRETRSTTIFKEKQIRDKLLVGEKRKSIGNMPAVSNLFSTVNNPLELTESKAKKRGQPSTTLLPKGKKVCKSTSTVEGRKKGGQSSKNLPENKEICKFTRITRGMQNKLNNQLLIEQKSMETNASTSGLIEKKIGRILIEETHKKEMPAVVNMWTQSKRNENVPSTSRLIENGIPKYSMNTIIKTEEPEIIDLTGDEDVNIGTTITKVVNDGTNSLVMNFYINAQNGDITKHVLHLKN